MCLGVVTIATTARDVPAGGWCWPGAGLVAERLCSASPFQETNGLQVFTFLTANLLSKPTCPWSCKTPSVEPLLSQGWESSEPPPPCPGIAPADFGGCSAACATCALSQLLSPDPTLLCAAGMERTSFQRGFHVSPRVKFCRLPPLLDYLPPAPFARECRFVAFKKKKKKATTTNKTTAQWMQD